jgi:hypothetical protein
MPLYEYICPDGHHTTRLCRYEDSYAPVVCQCGKEAARLFPLTHVETDGIYSYAPNVGTEADFERRHEAIKAGKKVIKREA